MHLDPRRRDGRGGLAAARLGPRAIGIGDQQPSQDAERRVAEQPPPQELVVGEAVHVERGRGADGVVARGVGLDDDPARHRPSPGSTGDLRQQLEGPLARPVVGQVEGDVGRDDRRERDRWQVEALRGELGPDEHVDAAVAEVVVDRLEAAAGGERVGVEPRDLQCREAGSQLGLDALRAGAEVPDPGAAAARAALGRSGGAPAVMAAQRTPGQVIDERKVAVRAAQALAAVAAEDEGRRSAAVDDQDRLLGPAPQGRERLGQRRTRRSTDCPPASSARRSTTEIDGTPADPALDEPRALGMAAADAAPGSRDRASRVPSTSRAPARAARRRATQRAS